ncbi:DUF1109 domain-containing protein [Burkholderia gladioli]|uniref:DUF1109 domain-containing protein n=1 Tax=Burkholderia gladioli TaxID=28095 RepID=UPI0016428AAD|nr:DUF1109 domain-containing protein [Burkholderia gladioli]
MKTRELVARLAADAGPVEPDRVTRRIGRALLGGLAGSIALLVALYGIRSDMPQVLLSAAFWIRLAFPLAIMVAAVQLTERLGRPGAPTRLAWFAAALPLAVMALAGIGLLLATPPGYRLQLMLADCWPLAVGNLVLLSLPPLAAAMHALKGLAPTRLALAGAGAGLAGAQGLLVDSLYGADGALSLWGLAYALAIGLTSALGAALAPRYLRW